MSRFLALLILVLAVCPAAAFDPFDRAGIDQRPGVQVPLDLTFQDESGKTVTLREVAGGKPILLAPVLHQCPNICGVTLAGLAQAIEAQTFVPGQDFALVAFGIDPKEGPPQAVASLARLQQAFPSLSGGVVHAVTGIKPNIAAVTDALGYSYAWDPQIGQYAHVAAVAVLTAQGKLTRWLYGVSPGPTDVKLALTEAGEGKLGRWSDQLLLLCYHYDPQTGRYGPVIWGTLRVAGAATVAVGLGFIGFSLLRERRKNGRSAP
ncbi:protein SCO1/2 [Rhodoligotrophos appendicifer]|uniref:SCO family protein n=1 Tax=Rhodoligotrophos appendicifer TaxID=987056 RepID=UPI001184CED0|nr:SCO family protein [Rhodoligotrophos appendicifer]